MIIIVDTCSWVVQLTAVSTFYHRRHTPHWLLCHLGQGLYSTGIDLSSSSSCHGKYHYWEPNGVQSIKVVWKYSTNYISSWFKLGSVVVHRALCDVIGTHKPIVTLFSLCRVICTHRHIFSLSSCTYRKHENGSLKRDRYVQIRILHSFIHVVTLYMCSYVSKCVHCSCPIPRPFWEWD